MTAGNVILIKKVDRTLARDIKKITMKQYSNTSSLSHHCVIAVAPQPHRYITTTLSLSYHCVIAQSLNCAIAPSSLHCRAILLSSFIMSFALSNYRFIAIELLLHRHRTIAYRCKIDSAMIDAIVNYMALSGFHNFMMNLF